MRRQKIPKRISRYVCLLTIAFLVFEYVRLCPLLLIQAAQTGNASLARFALKIGVSPNTQTSGVAGYDVINALVGRPVVGNLGQPVLMLATFGHSPAVVKLLLDAGADPNLGDGAEPPLMEAAMDGDAECAQLLLIHGADPNGRYKDGTLVLDTVPSDSVIAGMLKRAGAKSE